MIDWAHDWTDEQIKALEERFGSAYRRAAKELRDTTASLMKRYAAEIAKLSRGGHVPTEDELSGLLGRNIGQMSRLANVLAKTATNANEVAFNTINDALPGIYAENANWAAYQVDKGIGMNTGFQLVDESTVRRLMLTEEGDQIVHEFTDNVVRPDMQTLRANLDKVKDVRWNRQKFTASITQGILQGESIPHMAERLERVLNMNEAMATRAARTAATSVENAGRVDSFKRAKRIGIDLEQEWLAAIDGRTRYSHRELDGQHVPVGEKFYAKSTGHEIEFPGDPKAHPSETYNCRCTLVAWTPEMAAESTDRWSKLPKGTTYDEWKAGGASATKAAGQAVKPAPTAPAVPKGFDTDNLHPETVGGAKRTSDGMTFEEADGHKGNPRYTMADQAAREYDEAAQAYHRTLMKLDQTSPSEVKKLKSDFEEAKNKYVKARNEVRPYTVNCQSCVVANEARRRGYDVMAKAYDDKGVSGIIARDTSKAWIDPATGEKPKYIKYSGPGKEDVFGRPIPTKKSYWEWLNSDGVVEEGNRYTIEMEWAGRSHQGHIISMERVDGQLRLYDPQSGKIRTGKEVQEYLGQAKYKRTSKGNAIANGPSLLRVDNLEFNPSYVDEILEAASGA